MATINYKCDTCKREIELIENKTGLTTTSRCIITKNCRGGLYFVKRNPNNVRESLPKYDRELDDYTPRKLLHVHDQSIENTDWIIRHGFGESTVFIVYGSTGTVLPPEDYVITTIEPGVSLVKFPFKSIGTVHVLTRTGGSVAEIDTTQIFDVLLSDNGTLTFAIPKYITRLNSQTFPIVPPSSVIITPSVTPTPLPIPNPTVTPDGHLYSPCDRLVRIEIEVSKPNEPTITCTETLDGSPAIDNAWYGWDQILVRSRKHYCLRTKKIADLKVFANTNNQKLIIPEGTRLRIKRIDYGTGVLTNIPDRGLLLLLSDSNGKISTKILDQLVDCGEMVGLASGDFSFSNKKLYATSDMVENTYPVIKKYS